MREDTNLSPEDQELLANLKEWNKLYRAGDDSPVTDAQYDAHKEDFASRNSDHPFVIEVEPVVDVPEHRKEKLPIDMKSLDKYKTLLELNKWFTKCGVRPDDVVGLGPKWDGLSLLDNAAAKCWTRGGEDNNGMRSDEHLQIIDPDFTGKIGYLHTGGEVLISRKNFDAHWKGQLNPRDGKPWKTARGVMSGLMRNDTPSDKLKYVDYVRYFSPDLEHLAFDQYVDRINQYNNVKHPQHFVKVSEITDELMNELYDMWNEDYEIDGIVVMISDPERREELGRHHRSGNPKYAVAYKGDFEERLPTFVKGVVCKVSKQYKLVPTVPLETVVLSGAEVKNPTGYNMRWIVDNNIAKGTSVIVKRSGEVIPKIIETISYDKAAVHDMLDGLTECPACGSVTGWNENHVDIVCSNTDCIGQRLAEVISFFEIMKFEEFGEGAIEKLFDYGYDNLYDILTIGDNAFLAVDGLGDSGLLNFRNQVIAKLNEGVSLAQIMHASNKFSGLGSTKLQLIIDNLSEKTLLDLVEPEVSEIAKEEIMALQSVKGLAEKSLEAFANGLPGFMLWFAWLNKYEFQMPITKTYTEEEAVTGATCAGMAVCFSGFRDNTLETFIKSEGGEIKKSYSKKVTHLIVVDPNGTSSKIVKAKKDGCKVLTGDEFRGL